ncbi:MAG: hypothetical protein A2V67_15070 [Deltaproteobacteria bacterium RBG_13_61_14]|nr:MAG: hypothetical protein A2V67_15070 [Deltaproteobacteria bacterium RBG_13_61_14]
MESLGLAKAEWFYGTRPDGAGSDDLGPFSQSLTISALGESETVSTSISDEVMDIAPAQFDIRPQLLSYYPSWGADAGQVISDPFVAYLYYRHNQDEIIPGELLPLERVNPQGGSTIAANFAVRYAVYRGEGTVAGYPWQSPQDGATLDVWIANEADGRSEAWWRLGCLSGDTQELWVVGIKEVWGASERSARSWYLPIREPLPQYCVGQGSISIVDDNGEELQRLEIALESNSYGTSDLALAMVVLTLAVIGYGAYKV